MVVAVAQSYIDKGRRRRIQNNSNGGSSGKDIEGKTIRIRPTQISVAVARIDDG